MQREANAEYAVFSGGTFSDSAPAPLSPSLVCQDADAAVWTRSEVRHPPCWRHSAGRRGSWKGALQQPVELTELREEKA